MRAIRRRIGSALGALVAASSAAAMVFAVSGCSLGSMGKPSQEAVADALVRSADFSDLHKLGYSDSQVRSTAQCTAAAIYDDFSQDSLRKLVSGEFDTDLPKDEYSTLSGAMLDCALEKVGNGELE